MPVMRWKADLTAAIFRTARILLQGKADEHGFRFRMVDASFAFIDSGEAFSKSGIWSTVAWTSRRQYSAISGTCRRP